MVAQDVDDLLRDKGFAGPADALRALENVARENHNVHAVVDALVVVDW